MDMISTQGLARTFRSRSGRVEAVRGLDIRVAQGEIVGFLGPNGAGKTTTLRMLTTLLEPTAGDAIVAGADLRSNPTDVRRRIGYVAQGRSTDRAARAREELLDQAGLYGLSKGRASTRVNELITRFDLDAITHRMVKDLSGGQRRRLEVAVGLVHEPPLVFLDEPTAGLDPHSRANLWEHIRSLRDTTGTTVFLTTHYLDEADALCDRVLIIDHGKIIAQGTPRDLKRSLGGDVIALKVDGDPDRALESISAIVATPIDTTDDGSILVTVADGDQRIPIILHELNRRGVTVKSVQLSSPSLDDVFLCLTGRSLRDED